MILNQKIIMIKKRNIFQLYNGLIWIIESKKYSVLMTIFLLEIFSSCNSSTLDYTDNQSSDTTAITVVTTMNINTSNREEYNNLLLGTNIMGFTTSDEKDYIRSFDPITIRFPHGLFSNWYDWEQDKARVYGTDEFQYTRPDGSLRTQTLDYLSTIKLMDDHNINVGIDGLTSLNSEKKSNTEEGYDMLWTFNMSADGEDFNNGSPISVARYQDLISRGFQVKAIEMGNECFYPGQRSSIIPNTEDYIKRAKSMSVALKAQDPNIKVSIPLLRKSSSANPNWNADLTADKSYFDAVSVHTYIESDLDSSNSNIVLTARERLRKSIDEYAGKVAPNKPIWLSEWGVEFGGPNAVSALGMADCYIFMSQNQDRYQRADWFSVNGQKNSFLVWHQVDVNGTMRPRIKYPLEKTVFGSTYEIVRGVLENSILLESTVTGTNIKDGVDCISGRAVVKNGKLEVLVLNITDKDVQFQLNVDDSEYLGSFKQEAMSFSTMDEEKVLPIESTPFNLIKEGSGQIILPKYSINTILLQDVTITM